MNSTRNNNSRIIPSGGFKSNFSSTTVVVIIGILSVTILAIYIYNMYKDMKEQVLDNAKNQVLPAECPDYWVSLGNKKCKNVMKLGKCNKSEGSDVIDFDNVVFTNSNTGDYAKCKWARACDVYWGVIDRAC